MHSPQQDLRASLSTYSSMLLGSTFPGFSMFLKEEVMQEPHALPCVQACEERGGGEIISRRYMKEVAHEL